MFFRPTCQETIDPTDHASAPPPTAPSHSPPPPPACNSAFVRPDLSLARSARPNSSPREQPPPYRAGAAAGGEGRAAALPPPPRRPRPPVAAARLRAARSVPSTRSSRRRAGGGGGGRFPSRRGPHARPARGGRPPGGARRCPTPWRGRPTRSHPLGPDGPPGRGLRPRAVPAPAVWPRGSRGVTGVRPRGGGRPGVTGASPRPLGLTLGPQREGARQPNPRRGSEREPLAAKRGRRARPAARPPHPRRWARGRGHGLRSRGLPAGASVRRERGSGAARGWSPSRSLGDPRAAAPPAVGWLGGLRLARPERRCRAHLGHRAPPTPTLTFSLRCLGGGGGLLTLGRRLFFRSSPVYNESSVSLPSHITPHPTSQK